MNLSKENTMASSTLRPPQAPTRTAVLASADLSFRQRVRDALTGLRWQVREASGGAEALAHLDSGPADTVTYSGDSQISYVQTPTGQKIQTNVPGDQIFTAGPNVLGTLNNLIADFSSGTPSATSAADLTQLSSALNYVSQQRVTLDDSISRLTAAGNYDTAESTQLQSAQNNLIQADTAQVATQLSSAETQQSALTQVIAAIEKQGTLFDVLQ
jgi:flagellar hook-associated protein 3 FlgL